MALKKITLTEDHLILISNIKFDKFEINPNSHDQRFGWGVDQWNMFGGTYVLEEIAFMLGKQDQVIKGSEISAYGKQFPKELEDYMWGLYEYIYDNLVYIESLLHWCLIRGGLTAGTYKCIDYELIWEKVG